MWVSPLVYYCFHDLLHGMPCILITCTILICQVMSMEAHDIVQWHSGYPRNGNYWFGTCLITYHMYSDIQGILVMETTDLVHGEWPHLGYPKLVLFSLQWKRKRATWFPILQNNGNLQIQKYIVTSSHTISERCNNLYIIVNLSSYLKMIAFNNISYKTDSHHGSHCKFLSIIVLSPAQPLT